MKTFTHKLKLTFSLIAVLVLGFQLNAQVILTSPNGGETWVNGTTETITFNNLGINDYYEIMFSPDNGQNYYSIDFVYAPSGQNTISINVLYAPTDEAKIQVVNYSFPSNFDVSDAPFSIINPTLLITKPVYLELNYQNLPILVTWLRSDPTTIVDVSLSLDDGLTWTTVGEDIDATEFTFIAPAQSTSAARVKITNIADETDFSISDQFYIFPEPSITLLSPNGGEIWDWSQQTATIEWSGENLVSYIDIYFSTDGGTTYSYLTSGYSSPNGGSTQASIPYINTENARIKIVDGSGIADESDNPFTVYIPPVVIYYPTTNYNYYAGGDLTISWWSYQIDLVKIELSLDNGLNYTTIAENVNANLNIHYYEIPPTTFAEECVVRISVQNDPTQFDLSEVFEILPPPTITVVTPNGGEMWETNTQYEIEWTYDNMVYDYTNIWIDFSADNGLTWQYVGSVFQYGQVTSYTWNSPAEESDNCLFRIRDAYLANVEDVNDAPFSVRNIPTTPICMVSVDQLSGKNIIVWEPVESELIEDYVVYRETNQSNVYQEIGSVPKNDATVFIDLNSNPIVQASRYKLGFRDSEGFEYPKSDFHQTIHLTISPGVGNAWNLIWSPYLGFEVQSYNIYRGDAPDAMELIATISGNFTSYTDFGSTGGGVYYMVEVVSPNPCSPQNQQNGFNSFGSTTSNVASNILTAIADNQENQNKLVVYPIPANQSVNVKFTDEFQGKVQIEVINQLGQVVKTAETTVESMFSEYRLDVSDLQHGIYFLSVRNNDISKSTRIIINR